MSSRAPEGRLSKQSLGSSNVDVRSNNAATGGRASYSAIVPVESHSAPDHIVSGEASQASSQGLSEHAALSTVAQLYLSIATVSQVLAHLTDLQAVIINNATILMTLTAVVQTQ